MKRNVWMKSWLVGFLTIGVVCWHTPLLIAQDNEKPAPQGSTNVVTDAVNVVTNESERMPEGETPKNWRGPLVVVGGNATLRTNESAEVVVAIGGSARASGKVQDAVVAVGGNATADGDVGDAVVAVGGNALARGKVRDAIVAIAGDAEARGEVGDSIVAVFGDVTIGSNSVVHGDAVSIGGRVTLEEGGKVNGQVTEVGMGDHPLLAPLKGLSDWVKHCVFKVRLLAPQAGWYWIIAGLFLLCYLLITAAFPRPVAACLNELTTRPATTFLMGLLTKLLVPIIVLVLAMTGIGVAVVPFVGAAVFIAGMIGKAALFQYLGRQLVRIFGVQLPNPVLAMLTGFVLITLLYMVPVLSILVYLLTGIWGIGAAVTASFGRARKESPARPSSAPSAPIQPSTPVESMQSNLAGPAATPVAPGTTAFAATVQPSAASETVPSSFGTSAEPGLPPKPMSVPFAPPMPSEALTLPRASFWERLGAGFLDMIIVIIVVGLLPRFLDLVASPPTLTLLIALGYSAGMWTWKGTTIGGIVLNLKVVRLDDQPVTFAVALVRGLAAALSFVVVFLGFFWMIWDREKQTWHDKIAGTVVVRQSRSVPLVCL